MNFLDTISSFELLPTEAFSNILAQLNQVTGSEGIVNKADLPFVMRYARNIAYASKMMATKVNDLVVTNSLLQSLSEKYGRSPENFVFLLNTHGSREWIWNHIQKNGDYEAYQVIQDIYELASDVLKEAKESGLKLDNPGNLEELLALDPNSKQTMQGFALYINHKFPILITTPFGKMQIYGKSSFPIYSTYTIAEAFIRRLNAVLENVTKGIDVKERFQAIIIANNPNNSSNTEKGFFELVPSDNDAIRIVSEEDMKKLSKEDLESRNGTQNIIVSSVGFCGNYRIQMSKDKPLQPLKWHPIIPEHKIYLDPERPTRDPELIRGIWKMLEARLGQKSTRSIITPKKFPPKIPDNPLFTNISEVSFWAIDLVKKLDQQSSIKSSFDFKQLVLEVPQNAYTVVALNLAAREFLDVHSHLDILAFSMGLELGIGGDLIRCDESSLSRAYDLVIKNISQNWIHSELKNYPSILHTESEIDYALFVKNEKMMVEESFLISKLANNLGLSKSISCGIIDAEGNSYIYLWIKRDNLEKTLKAFNISG